MPIDIKLTSDFICPWCPISETALFKTIDALPGDIDVNVKWLPFELNPRIPKQGMDLENNTVLTRLAVGKYQRLVNWYHENDR